MQNSLRLMFISSMHILALLLVKSCHGLLSGRSFPSSYLGGRITRHDMFSGIVEEIGEVVDFAVVKRMKTWDGSETEGVELTVKAKKAVEDAYIGCSIAVNGVCLTATSFDNEKFTVGLAPETLRRTNLKDLKVGRKVNLERALQSNSRNSGHFVQGHVDCTAVIVEKWKEGDSLWMKMEVPSEYIRYIVPKGFICIDGTSLTVCDVHSSNSEKNNFFTIMLVQHTQDNVIFPSKDTGDTVNIEVDIMGKLVESSLKVLTDELRSKIVDLGNQNSDLLRRVEVLEAELRQRNSNK